MKNNTISKMVAAARNTEKTDSLTPPATAVMPPVSAENEDLHKDRSPRNATSKNRSTANAPAQK